MSKKLIIHSKNATPEEMAHTVWLALAGKTDKDKKNNKDKKKGFAER